MKEEEVENNGVTRGGNSGFQIWVVKLRRNYNRLSLYAHKLQSRMGAVEEETTEQEMAVEEDGDEYGLRRGFRSKYLLKERSLVDSRLDDIISNGCVSDPSSVNRIRSIMYSISKKGITALLGKRCFSFNVRCLY
ncbi:hypothetical protein MANES_05G127200v8 [Manihot esculenta]|uniref:Glucose-6-phosphate isomerase n=1 Tax=Manihot esculenta TaxID=3983 RepID=A0A2C9VWS8_MANES|nr:hypothetical protein MANES_05G127200v8 [Manihot esculenta]